MPQSDEVEHLLDSIVAWVDYQRKENDVTYVELIGVLEIMKIELAKEAMSDETSDT